MFAVSNFVQNVSVKYMNRNVGIMKYLLWSRAWIWFNATNVRILYKKLKDVIISLVNVDLSFVRDASKYGKKNTFVSTQCWKTLKEDGVAVIGE